MSALYRHTDGLKMSELSRLLMVSNGNVTGIVDRLTEDGLILRAAVPGDRRAACARLTAKGRTEFEKQAAAHEAWVAELLGGLDADDCAQVMDLLADPKYFKLDISDRIATVALDRPDRKNPLTFDSYAELRDWFRDLHYSDDVDAVVFASNGGNFSSGGDVHDIIGPLTRMSMKELLAFTRMTGDLVKAIINCGKPMIAAIDGVCVGAGAIIAMASDLRIATPEAKTAFLFTRVGLAGCDMGACAILPRIIGQGRAAELLYTGRSMSAQEGEAWGFHNKLVPAGELDTAAREMALRIAAGPNFGNMMTKTMLAQEWSMSIEQAIEAEAQAQAICMQTADFERAYNAFVAKEKPVFEGN